MNFDILDLHGHSHEDAEQLVHKFIFKNLEKLPVEIITGHSEKLRDLVISIIKQYNLSYHNQYWQNEGCLVITDKGV